MSLLHGELDTTERGRRLASFSEGRTRVLLTTDVAGEGLNLQDAARLVVMLEWPWSPLRLAQRIGRVHRIGQRRTVHAVHLTAASSYEETVVAHVQQRAWRADQALRLADAEVEHKVTSAVLDLPDQPGPVTGHDAPGADARAFDELALHREAVRVAGCRSLLRLAARDGADATWALPRRVARSARPVVLVEVVEQRPDGGTRGTAVAAVEVSLADRVRDVRSWRRCARRLATEPLVVHAAKTAAARDDQVDQWASVRERLDEIGHRSAPRRSDTEVQPSLFDRRAVRAADQRREAKVARDSWRARLRQRLVDGPALVSTRVIAVLPVHPRGE